MNFAVLCAVPKGKGEGAAKSVYARIPELMAARDNGKERKEKKEGILSSLVGVVIYYHFFMYFIHFYLFIFTRNGRTCTL